MASTSKVIHHTSTDIKRQISICLKGSVEVSGPKLDYTSFMWRVCCVVAYDITTNLTITKNTQYLLASTLFETIRHSSYLLTATADLGPHLELLCPIDVKGFTEYPIETNNFPNINRTRSNVFRYTTTTNAIARFSISLQLQACKFEDKNRDVARARGYIKLNPPDSDEYMKYFAMLEESIENSGEYNKDDVAAFITEGITAFTEKSSNAPASFIEKLKCKFGKKVEQKAESPKMSPPALDAFKMLEEAKLVRTKNSNTSPDKNKASSTTLCLSNHSIKK